MDEFLNQPQDEFKEEKEESVSEENMENQDFEEEPITDDFDDTEEEFTSVYNPINYTPVEEIKDYKPMSKGLKIFALIISAIILLTAGCTAGYFFGKTGVKNKDINVPSAVDLENIPQNSEQMSAAKVYQEVNKSVVGIVIYNTTGKSSQASGIVLSKEGYVVTNDHIYSEVPSAKFKIYAYNGKEYDATFVAGDTISDLAILKISNCDLEPAKFGDSDQLYYGQEVVAIGRPNSATEDSSITSGIISGLNRRVRNDTNYSSRLIQTSSAINPGSSGGALVNMYGQVIGVTSSKLASVSYEGIGYAIPTTVMKRITDELIAKGKVKTRAKLGITYTEIDSVTSKVGGYDFTGLFVASVSEDSGLYGKVNEGDVITHINGTEITNDDIMLDVIEQAKAGDKITVTVNADGKIKDIQVTLTANVGSSSYTTKTTPNSNSNGDGTFDFPRGE